MRQWCIALEGFAIHLYRSLHRVLLSFLPKRQENMSSRVQLTFLCRKLPCSIMYLFFLVGYKNYALILFTLDDDDENKLDSLAGRLRTAPLHNTLYPCFLWIDLPCISPRLRHHIRTLIYSSHSPRPTFLRLFLLSCDYVPDREYTLHSE